MAWFAAGKKFKRVRNPVDPVPSILYPKVEQHLATPVLAYLRLHTMAGLSGPEAACLTWDKVHFEDNAIEVHFTYRWLGAAVGQCKPNRHRTVNEIDPDFMTFLRALKISSGARDQDYVVEIIGAYGKPLGRQRTIELCNSAIKASQKAEGMKSLETEQPYKGKSFRDRYVIDRLNDPKSNLQKVQDEAGSSCATAFLSRFGSEYRSRNAKEQIGKLIDGMRRLGALDGMTPVSAAPACAAQEPSTGIARAHDHGGAR